MSPQRRLGMSPPPPLGEGSAPEPGSDAPAGPNKLLDPGLAGRNDRPVPGADNGYVAGYRVRFDEAGADGQVRTGSLLRYAQDIAWRHSEHLGFDRRWYTDQGRWWVVRSLELTVHQEMPMGSLLRVATAVVGHRRIWARRRGEFRLPSGRLAAEAMVDWVILDQRGRILRIPADFGIVFPNVELGGEILRVPLPLAPPDAFRLPLHVRPQDLDPMGHVNNAVYLDWIEEAVAAAGGPEATARLPRTIAIEYAASAEAGDDLAAEAWPDAERWFVRLARPGDDAVVVRAALR